MNMIFRIILSKGQMYVDLRKANNFKKIYLRKADQGVMYGSKDNMYQDLNDLKKVYDL